MFFLLCTGVSATHVVPFFEDVKLKAKPGLNLISVLGWITNVKSKSIVEQFVLGADMQNVCQLA